LQFQPIQEYFQKANSVDIHNQYRQGILTMERTWKTKSWNLRLFQTVMGTVLVNGLLAFKFTTGRSPSLCEFTNVMAQALCADEVEEADDGDTDRTRAQKQSRTSKVVVAPPSQRIKHALVKGTSIGVGGKRKQGPCNMCKDRHASGVCDDCASHARKDWILIIPSRFGCV
jgi:hypothetical protein